MNKIKQMYNRVFKKTYTFILTLAVINKKTVNYKVVSFESKRPMITTNDWLLVCSHINKDLGEGVQWVMINHLVTKK